MIKSIKCSICVILASMIVVAYATINSVAGSISEGTLYIPVHKEVVAPRSEITVTRTNTDVYPVNDNTISLQKINKSEIDWKDGAGSPELIQYVNTRVDDTVYYNSNPMASGGDDNIIPYTKFTKDNPNADLFKIYMSVIFQEPEVQFSDWKESYWTELQKQRSIWVDELIKVYNTGIRSQMVAWFLEYEGVVETMFPNVLFNNATMFAGRNFELPNLIGSSYTYMPIRLITSPTSYQYLFKQYLKTDEEFFTRYGDAYAVALGTHFGITIGGIYEIEYEDGEVIFAVLGDVKRDSETDPTHRFHPRILESGKKDLTQGNMIEFIMDDSAFLNLSQAERTRKVNTIVNERFNSPPVRITFLGVSEHSTIR